MRQLDILPTVRRQGGKLLHSSLSLFFIPRLGLQGGSPSPVKSPWDSIADTPRSVILNPVRLTERIEINHPTRSPRFSCALATPERQLPHLRNPELSSKIDFLFGWMDECDA